MSKTQYVAMFETGEKGKNYFDFLYLEMPDKYMPPPFIEMGKRGELVTFVWADDQKAIARAFQTSQQNVSRWMKNTPTPA